MLKVLHWPVGQKQVKDRDIFQVQAGKHQNCANYRLFQADAQETWGERQSKSKADNDVCSANHMTSSFSPCAATCTCRRSTDSQAPPVSVSPTVTDTAPSLSVMCWSRSLPRQTLHFPSGLEAISPPCPPLPLHPSHLLLFTLPETCGSV